MSDMPLFFPQTIYSNKKGPVPRVMIAPQRYIQGAGVLANTGKYLQLLGAKQVGILASTRGLNADAKTVIKSLREQGIVVHTAAFDGECSLQEIDTQVEAFSDKFVDCLIAIGGGKCVDAGKCIAYRLGIEVVIIPTLASNDAPTSAVSVLYTPQGVSSGAEFFPQNPAMVIVDTQVVANASPRYLVAGMGDAMATWYEARVCLKNPNATTIMGTRPTLAANAISTICAETLYDVGEAALESVKANRVDEALEKIVEANTLLSGLGFESGGLAVAHAVAQSYTNLPVVHANYLHGEMVAMGVLTQLMIEGDVDEANKAAEFFAKVGLPIHLGQLSVEVTDSESLNLLAKETSAYATVSNMPMAITEAVALAGVIAAHELGLHVEDKIGNAAYMSLRI